MIVGVPYPPSRLLTEILPSAPAQRDLLFFVPPQTGGGCGGGGVSYVLAAAPRTIRFNNNTFILKMS